LPNRLYRYKELFVKSLPENRRADVRFDRNVFPTAAFFLTAEYKKKKVDKKKLLECAGVTYPDFDSVSVDLVRVPDLIRGADLRFNG